MKLFLYTRVAEYHQETYTILAKDEDDARKYINEFTDFEMINNNMKYEKISEVDLSKSGIAYINSYYQ